MITFNSQFGSGLNMTYRKELCKPLMDKLIRQIDSHIGHRCHQGGLTNELVDSFGKIGGKLNEIDDHLLDEDYYWTTCFVYKDLAYLQGTFNRIKRVR